MLIMKDREGGEREPQLQLLLARGEKEIAAGEGFSLDQVLADADALLAGGPRENSSSLSTEDH
jgi:hypothetical protein